VSALLVEHPVWALDAPRSERPVPRAAERVGAQARGGQTLDELITGVWEGLCARQTARCPACGGAMTPVVELGPRRMAAACADCGSGLE
jgi:hypothetical protein